MPNTVYAEGIEASTTLRDIEVILEYEAYSSSFELQDRIRLTVIEVKLNAYEAWRGNDDTMIEDTEKIVPGMLITPNIDDIELDDPLEAKLIFKGIPSSFGLTRHVTFSESGRVEFRFSDESVGPTVPTASVNLNGIVSVTADFTRDVAMHNPELWGTGLNSVVVTYIVRDAQGKEVGRDAVRLLRPVVIPIGDSLTFGYMANAGGTPLTANWGALWDNYPASGSWTSIDTNARATVGLTATAVQTDIENQGWRGYLQQKLPGFYWAGETANNDINGTGGHGPRHCGYSGAKAGHVNARLGCETYPSEQIRQNPQAALQIEPCYAIIIYFIGMNDCNDIDETGENIYSEWKIGLNKIQEVRQGKGKSLILGLTLPKQDMPWPNATQNNIARISPLNLKIRAHSMSEITGVRFVVADCEVIDHLASDDGLHFLPAGHMAIGDKIFTAIIDGVSGQ